MDNEQLPEMASRPTVGIQFADDVERHPRRVRSRTGSFSSVQTARSVRSVRSLSQAREVVDPATVLPAAYRTISMNIEECRSIGKSIHDPSKTKKEQKTEDELSNITWHKYSVDEILTHLSTSPKQGLAAEQVPRRLKEYGPNKPSPPPSQWFRRWVGYFFGGFGAILLLAGILVLISWKPLGQPPSQANLALAIVLFVVFFAQASFNFVQDWSSSRVMASITGMLPEQTLVLRDGTQQHIDGMNIVPGDLLVIKMGDKLPADVRFIETTTDARFDRSILTGETVPLHGTIESTDDNYLETACIGMAGTHCVSGSAIGVVVATGDKTVFGRIARLTSAPKTGSTTLQKEIMRFVTIIVALALTMIIVVIIVWAAWLRKSHPDWIPVAGLIVDIVTVAVAFIPEGLPIAVTSSLTIVANTMKRNKVLCKSLKTVETLGSVSVICSDKTGTLTRNAMTVTNCLANAQELDVQKAVSEVGTSKVLQKIAHLGAICNAGEFDASTNDEPLEKRKINGDATDQAVLRFAEQLKPVEETRNEWNVIFKIAFNSKNKYMINVIKPVDAEEDCEKTLTIKGAPDILLPLCETQITEDGSFKDLTEADRAAIELIKNDWSSKGKRVILLAQRPLPLSVNAIDVNSRDYEQEVMEQATAGLQFVGLVAIVDPPRAEIPEVVRTLRGAGIRVHMVTGDFKLTAQAIAAECGIITNRADQVDDVSALESMSASGSSISEKATNVADATDSSGSNHLPTSITLSGAELNDLSDEAWSTLCRYDEIVFARTTPEQKLRIVKEFQKREEIVGMTGDGVNDAPSLKAADIGIAMGSGSDVAMEAADMVLLESFAAIVEAVRYGRVVYDNLKKTVCYLLPAGSFSEFWPIMTNVLFGMPQVLSSFLMIIICCFTDCAAATAIAYEKPEADVLLRRPRNVKKDRLVDWRLLLQAYGFLGLAETLTSFAMAYWYAQRKGVAFSVLSLGFGRTPANLTVDETNQILVEASSIYFINLVIMQWFNLMATRTRRLSLIQHPPIGRKSTQNLYLFAAIIFAFVVAILFLYTPSIQRVLGTSRVPAENFFFPMAFGVGILLLDETRKFLVRNYPNGFLAKIAW